MTAHLLVMYPPPQDPKAFDLAYRTEHLPYAGPRLTGASKVTTQRVTAGGQSPFHTISDVAFPSLEALQACAASPGAKEALRHAASISSGGPPVVLVVVDEA